MDYSHLSFAQLRQLRDQYPDDSPMQAQLAPYEHQAFAREWRSRASPKWRVAIAESGKGCGL